MNDERFRELCNTYGFAPSRALRELIDCVRAQEIAACVRLAEETKAPFTADVIRARKDKQ